MIRFALAILFFASLAAGTSLASDEPGDLEWLARYDSPDHGSDGIESLCVTEEGVFITGETLFAPTSSELFVARFDLEGNLVWSAQYDGPGTGVHRGLDIAVTPAGNVVVVGQSGPDWPTGDLDMLVIQYDGAGNEQWVRLYDGPAHKLDRGTAVAVDAAGNVFAAGYSAYEVNPQYGTQSEYVIISYDPAGEQRWFNTYRGPASPNNDDLAWDIAADSVGDVIVTGSDYTLGQSWNFGTVKYRGSDGAHLWDRQYHFGIPNVIDEAFAVAVGPADEVAVTGLSYRDPFNGLAVDALTVVYESDGTERWTARYNGPGNEIDQGEDVDFDTEGRVAVCGHTEADYLTILYDAAGQEKWIRVWDGPQQISDFGEYVATGADGSVYVTGEAGWDAPGRDIVTLAYDGQGELLWEVVHDTTLDGNDDSGGIAVDEAGDVYVAATSPYNNEGVHWDGVVLKYTGGAGSLAVHPSRLPVGGGVAEFTLDAGPAYAGRDYILLGGVSGTEPGTLMPGGVVIPINVDDFTLLALQLVNTQILQNFNGQLDSEGAAGAALHLPPLDPGFVGLVMHYAFVTMDPIDFASIPVDVEIVP